MLAKLSTITLALVALAATVCAAPVEDRGVSGSSVPRIGISEISPTYRIDTGASTSTSHSSCTEGSITIGDGSSTTVTAGEAFTLTYCPHTSNSASMVFYSVMAIKGNDQSTGVYLTTRAKTTEVTLSVPETSYDSLIIREKQTIEGKAHYQFVLSDQTIQVVSPST